MPQWDITDQHSGDTFTIEADEAPSQDDVLEIFQKHRAPTLTPEDQKAASQFGGIKLSPYEQQVLGMGGRVSEPPIVEPAELGRQIVTTGEKGLEYAGRGAEWLGKKMEEALITSPTAQAARGYVKESLPPQTPTIADLPEEGIPQPAPGEKGIIPSLQKFGAGLTTRGSALTLPLAGVEGVVGKGMQAMYAAGAAEGAVQAAKEWEAAQTPAEKTGAAADFLLNATLAGHMTAGLRGAPEKIVSAAFKDAEGNVHTGANHPEVVENLGRGEQYRTRESRNTDQFGYWTSNKRFLPRSKAGPVAKAAGQQLEPFDIRKGEEQPHSDEIESPVEPGTPLGDVPQPVETKPAPEKIASDIGVKFDGVHDYGFGTPTWSFTRQSDGMSFNVPVGSTAEAVRTAYETRAKGFETSPAKPYFDVQSEGLGLGRPSTAPTVEDVRAQRSRDDRQRFNELQSQMRANTAAVKAGSRPASEAFEANAALNKEIQQIKNRSFGGKTPEAFDKEKAEKSAEPPMAPKAEPALEPLSSDLENEIGHLRQSFGESADPGESLSRNEAIKRLMEDMDDPDLYASKFKKELEDYGAKIGIYKPYTKSQLDQITVSRGRKYDFKRGDTYYVFESWEPLRESPAAGTPKVRSAFDTLPPTVEDVRAQRALEERQAAAEKAKAKPKRQKKLLRPNQISDFRPGIDKVERRGDRTFVVDTQGQRAPVEVEHDALTPEIEANIRKLPKERIAEYRAQTARTPFLSAEGKAERLKIFDEVMKAAPKTEAAAKPRTKAQQAAHDSAVKNANFLIGIAEKYSSTSFPQRLKGKVEGAMIAMRRAAEKLGIDVRKEGMWFSPEHNAEIARAVKAKLESMLKEAGTPEAAAADFKDLYEKANDGEKLTSSEIESTIGKLTESQQKKLSGAINIVRRIFEKQQSLEERAKRFSEPDVRPLNVGTEETGAVKPPPEQSELRLKTEAKAKAPKDFSRGMEIEKRWGLSAAEAAVISEAIERVKASPEKWTTLAEGIQKEALRLATTAKVSMSKIGNIKLTKEIAEAYLPPKAKPAAPPPVEPPKPPEPPAPQPPPVPTPEAPKATYGIAQWVREKRAKLGQVDEVVPLEGISPQEAVEYGRALLVKDPQAGVKALDAFEADPKKAISLESISVTRAHGEYLEKAAEDMKNRYGRDSEQYAAARKELSAWDKRTKPMQNVWHRAGEAQQGETDINTGSFTGLERAYEEATEGEKFTPEQATAAEEIARKKKKADETAGTAEEATKKEIGRATAADTASMTKAERRAFDAANKTVREAAARRAEAENKARVADEKLKQAVEKVQADAKRRADSSQVIRDAARRLAAAEAKARSARPWEKAAAEARLKAAQDALDAAYKTVRTAAMRVAARENAGRVESATRAKQAADVQVDATKRAQAAADKTVREAARRTAEKIRIESEMSPQQHVLKKAQEYIEDLGMDDLDDIITKIGTELGMKTSDVIKELGKPPRLKYMLDDVWKKKLTARRLDQAAKRWLVDQTIPWFVKKLRQVPRVLFQTKVGFHGTVALGTHAPGLFFRPDYWKTYFTHYGKMYKLVGLPYPKGQEAARAYYEQQVRDLVRKPNYWPARRAGLQNDPFQAEEMTAASAGAPLSTAGKLWAPVGKFWNSITDMGNRGYFVLKLLRQEIFDQRYNYLPRSMRATPELQKTLKYPEMAEAIAKEVNHITGVTKTKAPSGTEMALFAPRLEASRLATMVVDPIKAMYTVARWNKATKAQKRAAIEQARSKATIAATYYGLLMMNQGFLSATGSDQKINVTDPLRADFMKFKGGGMTFAYGNPFLTLMRLPVRMWHMRSKTGKYKNLVYPDETSYGMAGEYIRSQLSPAASLATTLWFQRDWQERPLDPDLPMPKRLRAQGIEPYTAAEFITEASLPIPFEEAAREVWRTGFGMNEEQIKQTIKAMATLSVMSATGMRVGEDIPYAADIPPRPLP